MMNTTPTDLTLPLFHMNGNSVERLTEQYQNAFTKLQEFVDAFGEIEFHARDYYPLGMEAWNKAEIERGAARTLINGVYRYLEAHVEHCYDNGK